MTTETPLLRRRSRLRIWLIPALLLLLCCACILPDLLLGLIQVAAMLVLGWIHFLQRVRYQVRIDPQGILVGVGALVLLIGGIQYLIRRLFPNQTWTMIQTTRSVIGVMGIFLAGICLTGLGHELSWSMRSQTPWFQIRDNFRNRLTSSTNLLQIGLAMIQYDSVYHAFPPGGGFRHDGTAEHGWMTALLPYLGEESLYAKIHFDVPWYDPVNRPVFETRISHFENQGSLQARVPSGQYVPATYSGNNRLLMANRGFQFNRITDGAGNTIVAGEVREKLRPWGDAANCRNLDLGVNQSAEGFGGPTRGGAYFLFADGSVKFISSKVDPELLHALATPDAGDAVGDY